MGMVMVEGRNNGYPCIAELPELNGIGIFVNAPYPQYFFNLDSTRNNGYPSLERLPEMSGIVGFRPLFPEYMMQCYGDNVNGGYPAVRRLAGVKTIVESKLSFADKEVVGMYYNGEFISRALCSDEEVFGVSFGSVEKSLSQFK
ncbi:MAG: hypothetical protein E7497_01620 [Ruminococcus sp.]|nr:hypothetical protein [Ruminococcus sp.]